MINVSYSYWDYESFGKLIPVGLHTMATVKVSHALRNTDLQQSHSYFDTQIYISTHSSGYFSAVLRYGVRIVAARLFQIP